jgi:hypothetical protein
MPMDESLGFHNLQNGMPVEQVGQQNQAEPDRIVQPPRPNSSLFIESQLLP